MRLIVDEIPIKPCDCLFSKLSGSGNWICGFTSGVICEETEDCNRLAAITDFYAEDIISRYEDGTYYAKELHIKDGG